MLRTITMGRNTYKPFSPKLPELVKSKFNNAKANGDINFYPTQVAVLKPDSIPVRLASHFLIFSQGGQTINNNE